MSSGHKKVVIRKRNRDWLSGYLPASGFVEKEQISILDLQGKVVTLQLRDIKWICFVRDFQSGDVSDPERLLRRSFAGRPRGEGLWLRLEILEDEAPLEGLAANNLSLVNEEGILLTPPDTRGNTQRIFLPHSSLAAMEVVAVIGGAARRKPSPPAADEQPELFRQESLLEE